MSTTLDDSKAYSIGKYERSKYQTFTNKLNWGYLYRGKVCEPESGNKCTWTRSS